jgi:DNA-binding transcriptional LysR family regulator
VIIVGAGHALSRRPSIRLQELPDWPIVSFAKGSETRTVFEEVLQRQGISLTPIMETFSSEGIKRAVEAGIGIAPFLLRPAERELREKTLVALPIDGKSILRVHNFVYRSDYPLSPVARQFKAFVLDAIRKGWTGPAAHGRSAATADR